MPHFPFYIPAACVLVGAGYRTECTAGEARPGGGHLEGVGAEVQAPGEVCAARITRAAVRSSQRDPRKGRPRR